MKFPKASKAPVCTSVQFDTVNVTLVEASKDQGFPAGPLVPLSTRLPPDKLKPVM
jgi:hypothetical protein